MIVCQTPLRISLAGGGTDLEAFWGKERGVVVSTAIDKYVFVIVNERFDDKIYLNYSQKEIVDSVDDVQHELIREALRMTGVAHGVEITTLADIPSEGSGLGSSSSITVGLLNALYAHQGRLVDAETLARQACEIEIDILKKPIGKQDQTIAAYGGLRRIEFAPDGTTEVASISLSGEQMRVLGSRLMLFYTDQTRKADAILGEQRQNTGDKMDALRRIRDLAVDVDQAVRGDDLDAIGHALRENWELKRSLAGGITNPTIDQMVDDAHRGGALGCKISGAGGGGFLLCYCPRHAQDELRATLSRRELPFMLERDGSKIIFNYRRYAARM